MGVKLFKTAAAFAFAAASASLCAADDGAAVFPVSCWTYMRFEQQTRPAESVVRDWKDLGITHPLMPVTSGRTDKAAVRRMLDLCGGAGLKVLMCDERVDNPAIMRLRDSRSIEAYRKGVRAALADWGSHPAVAGFYLYDEPDSNIVSAVCAAARVCREEDPSKIWYLNLLPWYDWIGPRIGCQNYAVYLDRVAERSGLLSMGYDFYEQQNEVSGPAKGENLHFLNLRQWMELSLRRPGFRFSFTPICLDSYNYRVRSQDDLRWQINTAVAMGAKALVWYYPDMSSAVQGCSQNNRNAPINVFGERTASFEWLSYENRLFQRQYGSVFAGLSIESAWMTGEPLGGIAKFAGDAEVAAVASPDRVLVSFFRDAGGVRYMAAVNLSRDFSRHVNFTFAPAVSPHQRVFTREWVKLATNADPVAERDAGGRAPHRAGRYLAPGQIILVRLDR